MKIERDPRESQGKYSLTIVWISLAAIFLSTIPASAEVTGVKINKEEAITVGGKAVRHVAGVISGKAEQNEPKIPTLDKVLGLQYETPFELWIPASGGNGRLWFSVLNRGNDIGGLRDSILRRGGAYTWCAWQAKNVAEPRPQLKLTGFAGPMPQAYGLAVVRDYVSFLRHCPNTEEKPNPAAGKVQFTFAYGISQSARFMRTFLLHGLNNTPQGIVFDGLMPNGGRAGYVDLFRPNSDPGSGGTFSTETVYAPYAWSKLMARSQTDAKVFVLNAESEYYEMMAYMCYRGPVPANVRVFDFPLGGHGGGGAVPWNTCVQPLAAALEEWACQGTKPPDNRMFILEKRESPRVKHLPTEPVEMPVTDELGIPKGGVRLPAVELPLFRYVAGDGPGVKVQPLDKTELTRRHGTPENYRKKVAETVDRLIQERFLPESLREKYLTEARKVNW